MQKAVQIAHNKKLIVQKT